MVAPNELVLIDLAFPSESSENHFWWCAAGQRCNAGRHLKTFVERKDYLHDNPKRAGKTLWQIDFFRDVDALGSGNYRQW